MKKRVLVLFLAGVLSLSALLGGCGTKARERANEYKAQGISAMEEEDYSDAVTEFQNALDQSNGTVTEEEVDLCFYKALAQLRSGDTEAAIETYTGLISYDEENWEAYYLRGCAYLQGEDKDPAIADFDQAVSLNKNDFDLYVNIYETLTDAGYTTDAQGYLDLALTLKDNDANAYGLGYCYYLKGDMDAAKTYLEKACAAGKSEAYLLLGRVYISTGDTEAANEALEQYMEACPDDVQAVIDLGMTALEEEDYTSAIGFFSKAKDAADLEASKTAWYDLVVAYEKNADYENALQEAESYLAAYAGDSEMQHELEFLQTRVTTGQDTADAEDTEETEETTDAEETEEDGSGEE